MNNQFETHQSAARSSLLRSSTKCDPATMAKVAAAPDTSSNGLPSKSAVASETGPEHHADLPRLVPVDGDGEPWTEPSIMPYPGPGIKLPAELAGVVETYRMQCQYWRKRALTAEESNEELETENSQLKVENDELKTEKSRLSSKLNRFASGIRKLQAELADSKGKYDKLYTLLQRKLDLITTMEMSHVGDKQKWTKELEEQRTLCEKLTTSIEVVNILADQREMGNIARDLVGDEAREVLREYLDVKGMDLDALAQKVGELVDEGDVDYDPEDMADVVRSLATMCQEFSTFLHGFRPTDFAKSFDLWRKKIIPATCPDLSSETETWVDTTLRPAMEQKYDDKMREDAKRWNRRQARLMQKSGQVLKGLRDMPTDFPMSSFVDIPDLFDIHSPLPSRVNKTRRGRYSWGP